MPLSDDRWLAAAESEFPHEQKALEYLRGLLPDRNPFLAFPTFQFVAQDGTVNEVDLLVVSAAGVFVVEIKSYRGRLRVAPGQWTHDKVSGRRVVHDNPLTLTDRKCKRIKSIFEASSAFRGRRVPYVEPLVFVFDPAEDRVGAPSLTITFEGHGDSRTFVPDDVAEAAEGPGFHPISAALLRREGAGIQSRFDIDKEQMKAVRAALEGVIGPSLRLEELAGWELGEVIEEGPRYQDRVATIAGQDEVRRARIFLVAKQQTREARRAVEAARDREFEYLRNMRHENVLAVRDKAEHDLGPALFFEHHPEARNFGAWIVDDASPPSAAARLAALEQVGEAVRYAHRKGVIHRALTPRSVLVLPRDPHSGPLDDGIHEAPEIRVYNWMTARHTPGVIDETQHVDAWHESSEERFFAPELTLATDEADTAAADVWGLGVLTFFAFAREAPALSSAKVAELLQRDGGLRLASRADGISSALDDLVWSATRPTPDDRPLLTELIDALGRIARRTGTTTHKPEHPKDTAIEGILADRFRVKRVLGEGSTAVALEVEDLSTPRRTTGGSSEDEEGDARKGVERVLKVARTADDGPRLLEEAATLERLDSPHIVRIYDQLEIDGYVTLVLAHAGATLRARLQESGRLSVAQFCRFGTQLSEALVHLERANVLHRDIKPDNISLGRAAHRPLEVILYDFSLASAPLSSTSVGTARYRDPYLGYGLRDVWDDAAERYAVALTLHEMITGELPVWGDGVTNPATAELELSLAIERFPPVVRTGLEQFFRKALAREVSERFATAEEQLAAWRALVDPLVTTHHDELAARVAASIGETPLSQLGLSEAVVDALHERELRTISDMLDPEAPGRLADAAGMSGDVRRAVHNLKNLIYEHFLTEEQGDDATAVPDPERASIDQLHRDLLAGRHNKGTVEQRERLRLLFDYDYGDVAPSDSVFPWPATSQLAEARGIAPSDARVEAASFAKMIGNKSRFVPLARDLLGYLESSGGVATDEELTRWVRHRRGSASKDNAEALRRAAVVTRALVESMAVDEEPPVMLVRRPRALFVHTPEFALAGRIGELGEAADGLTASDERPHPDEARRRLLERFGRQREHGLLPERVLAIAAAASQRTALSARNELYPIGMSARHALELTGVTISDDAEYAEEQLRDIVASRFPDAERLPGGGALDALIRELDIPLKRRDVPGEAESPFVSERASLSRSTRMTAAGQTSVPTTLRSDPDSARPAPLARRQQTFREEMGYAIEHGGYAVLMAHRSDVNELIAPLCEAWQLTHVRLDALVIEELRAYAADPDGGRPIDWSLIEQADGEPAGSPNGRRLRQFLTRALERVKRRLRELSGRLLVTDLGLLARYDAMWLLHELRERAVRRDGVEAVLLLIPQGKDIELPTIVGPTPAVITTEAPSERIRAPKGLAGFPAATLR